MVFKEYRVGIQLFGDASRVVFLDVKAKNVRRACTEALKKASKQFNTEYVRLDSQIRPNNKACEWKLSYLLCGEICNGGGFRVQKMSDNEIFETIAWDFPAGLNPLSLLVLRDNGEWDNIVDEFENFLLNKKK